MEFDNEKVIRAVEQTGFVLEHYISEQLRLNGWQVINNRYYIDDLKNIEREIDIMAYKAMVNDHIAYYTVLIISCKKATKGIWTFLTRRRPERDPNTDYFVVDNYTTDKRLSHMLKSTQERIKSILIADQDVNPLFQVEHLPFAFQQINSESYKTEDDKRIYDSIITTIKALEYEKENRSRPVIEGVSNYFYNFNLLSIFDGNILEVFFDDAGQKEVSSIDEIKYVNRHIVSKKEAIYKVHFLTKEAFLPQLEQYSKLHSKNCKVYPDLINQFYSSIFSDPQRANIYWSDFSKEINWRFNYTLIHELGYKSENRADSFSYDYDDALLKIHFDGYYDIDDPDFLERVNAHEELKTKTAKLLKRLFRYEGNFCFDNDFLPF